MIARSRTPRTSSSVSGSRVSSSERESSGEITEKNGFSVVAATRVTQRFSTPGNSASCCALVNRCTSSTNSTVSLPLEARRLRAELIASRTSLTPAATAETSTKCRLVWPETIEAIVVLPVPGGPHSSSDIDWSPSTSRRSGAPGVEQVLLARRSSSRSRGRIRTARGAESWVLPASVPPEEPLPGSARGPRRRRGRPLPRPYPGRLTRRGHGVLPSDPSRPPGRDHRTDRVGGQNWTWTGEALAARVRFHRTSGETGAPSTRSPRRPPPGR